MTEEENKPVRNVQKAPMCDFHDDFSHCYDNRGKKLKESRDLSH